jgi:hypothetical protein
MPADPGQSCGTYIHRIQKYQIESGDEGILSEIINKKKAAGP